MPLLHIAPQKRRNEGSLRRDTVREWAKKLSRAVGEHPFYLDVRGIPPTAPVELVGHQQALLSQLFALARKRHMRALPVAWVGKSSKGHLDMLKTAAQVDQLGIALRFSFANVALPVGMTRAQVLVKCLDDLDGIAGRADHHQGERRVDGGRDRSAEPVLISFSDSFSYYGDSYPVLSTTPYARTGKVPRPRTLTGAAWKRKPEVGSAARWHRCSTIGMPAPSKSV
jgi:hypothetical protein